MTSALPEFGVAVPGIDYVLRPGGYAVIFNAAGEVATVSTPMGGLLPGGGQNDHEPAHEAALREVEEECGLRIVLGRLIGIADELVFAEQEKTYYRKRCTFFVAEVVGQSGSGEADHELAWLSPAEAVRKLRHESQQWAVAQVLSA